MRVVVTGGAGFIGRAVVERLVARGDEVVALVRDPAKAAHIEGDHVTLMPSDLSSTAQLTVQMRGADAVIHAAGSYRVGSSRPSATPCGTRTLARRSALDAAVAAGVRRVVYVSTVNVFGDTNGQLVDESYRRDLKKGFFSWYDETKFRRARGGRGTTENRRAAVVIATPSQVYGPNDHSEASAQLDHAYHGNLRYVAFPTTGLQWVHVHDLADGIVAALDRGRIGESYVLAGDPHRLGESVEIAARVAGRNGPRMSIPTGLLRAIAPLNDRIGGLPGMPANMRETISAAENVTYWAKHDKATAELGFKPRSLEQGIADTWGRAAAASAPKRA